MAAHTGTGRLACVETQKDSVYDLSDYNSAERVTDTPDRPHKYATEQSDHTVAVFAQDVSSSSADTTEPNDIRSQATPITLDADNTYSGNFSISAGTDQDWYAINLTAGDSITVTVDVTSDLDARLVFYDSQEVRLESADYGGNGTDEEISRALINSSGTYFIGVGFYKSISKAAHSAADNGAYTLTVSVIPGIDTSPEAAFLIAPPSGILGTTFSFNASASSDSQDATSALQVRWDWQGDGIWDTGFLNTLTTSHVFDTIGVYKVTLEVRDSKGLTAMTSRYASVVTLGGTGALKFVELQRDGVNGVDGLDVAWSVTVSPDGANVYVTGPNENAVAVFTRDASTGALTFVEVQKNGVNGVDGLLGAGSVTVSPDGTHVYVSRSAANDLSVFARDAGTGRLTFVDVQPDGVEVPYIAYSVTISPDGRHVYVTGPAADALAVFARDVVTGRLTFVEAQINGINGVSGIKNAYGITVSPDGAHVYVAGRTNYGAGALAMFARNAITGTLTFVESMQNGFGSSARTMMVSPDGAHVYVAGGNTVTVFARDANTGTLTFVEAQQNGINGVEGLVSAISVIVSPDGAHVYVTGDNGPAADALAVFSRNADTGTLTFVEFLQDGFNGVDGLAVPYSVTVSPDGANVYVAGSGDNAVAVFSRGAPVAPMITDPSTQSAKEGERFELQLIAEDLNGDDVSFSKLSGPDALTVSTSGLVSWTPAIVDVGKVTVKVLAMDNSASALSDTMTIIITVEESVPVASFSIMPVSGPISTNFTVDATNSTGVGIQVRWDWEDDGIWDTAYSSNQITSHTYMAPGVYRITLDVKDSRGLTTTISNYATVIIHGGTGALTFVESQKDGVGGVEGLIGAENVIVSLDGKSVYAGGNDSKLAVFSRDMISGALSFVKVEVIGGVSKRPAFSPDGKHLYYTAGAVISRDIITGELTFVEYRPTVEGLKGQSDIEVSPDGKHVYVTFLGNTGAVVLFDRNIQTGELTYVSAWKSLVNGASGISIAPNGRNVYVTGSNGNTLTVFSRDEDSGLLTFVEIHHDDQNGVDGLQNPYDVAISPGGESVYVGGRNDDAVAVFARDTNTGKLTFVEAQMNGVNSVDGLNGAISLTVSPDGNHIYVAGTDNDAIAVFARDTVTSALTHVDAKRDNINGVDGLDGIRCVTISPDGAHIYAASYHDNAVAVFSRGSIDNTPPKATFVVTPYSGTIDTIFNFNASLSSDSQDVASDLQVRWDWEGDGIWDTSYDATKIATYQYADPGTYKILLEVKDSGGLTDTVSHQVYVSPEPNQTLNDGYGDYVFVPAGEFLMGDNFNEGDSKERPVHTVNLDSYYIGKYEVTNGEYKKFVDDGGYATEVYWSVEGWAVKQQEGWSQPLYWMDQAIPEWNVYGGGIAGNEQYPIAAVSWYEAQAYCKWLSLKTGITYRLPTEAEWEKAVRGTTQWRYPWGNNIDSTYANFGNSGDPYDPGLTPVGFYNGTVHGSFQTHDNASPYSAYDMAGNVLEWCSDWYGNDYYSSSSASNSTGPESGTSRVFRGGGWGADVFSLRATMRDYGNPISRPVNAGFRCLRTVGGVAANTSPSASYTFSSSSGTTATTFTFDASSSSDTEDVTSVLLVRWDWDSDGTYDTAWDTTKTAAHQYGAAGSYTVTLEVRDTGGLTHAIQRTITVSAAVPEIAVSATALDFGSVKVGNSQSRTFSVTNAGTGALTVSNITTPSGFSINPNIFAVQPGDSQQVTVTFNPTAASSYSGDISIRSNDTDTPVMMIHVTGTGFEIDAVGPVTTVIQVSPNPTGTATTVTLTAQVSDANNGNSILAGTEYFIGSVGNSGAGIIMNAADGGFDTPTEAVTANIGVAGLTSDTVTIYVHGKDASNNWGPVVSVNIIVSDVSSPTIAIGQIANAESGQAKSISAEITDNGALQTIRLFYRQGGTATYASVDMTKGTGNTYNAVIPASIVNEKGLDYYIEAVDNAGNRKTYPESNPASTPQSIQVAVSSVSRSSYSVPAIPAGTSDNDFRMISVPIDLTNKSPLAVFGDDLGSTSYDKGQWRIFRWLNGSMIEYPGIGTVTPGKAFWIICKSANPAIDASDGMTVSTSQEFTLTLPPGWSQVGNPFAFEVAWADILAATGAGLESQAHRFSGTGYVSNITSFVPWDGYWVRNATTGDITLKIPPKEATVVGKASGALYSLGAMDWVLRIAAECGGKDDRDNYLGVSSQAENTCDALDFAEPPPIGDYVSVYFSHDDWDEHSGRYAGDFRMPFEEGMTWEFTVDTKGAGGVTLAIDGLPDVPEHYEVYVFDLAGYQQVNLRDRNTYQFESAGMHADMDDANTRQFRLAVGLGTFIDEVRDSLPKVPADYILSQNYPNPFNPETSIRFSVPNAGKVKVRIFNLLGQVVQTLIDDELPVGWHTVVWDGTNETGVRVASGVYIYTMETATGSVTARKLILMK